MECSTRSVMFAFAVREEPAYVSAGSSSNVWSVWSRLRSLQFQDDGGTAAAR
jgi:hypothetical protein